MKPKARVIALYLPQFHPIPENDKWWGEGFTEWTNVRKAKPLYKGHYQPRVPADLGYYDLRDPQVRERQAALAKEAGIEGFCYWHYWFEEGKELLERPFHEVLSSGKPDFPFCLGWANETWTNKSWHEGTRKMELSVLMEQKYSVEDYRKHFMAVLPAFRDPRYITVDGCPLFLVYQPMDIPNLREYTDLWHQLAIENGLKGIHLVGIRQNYDIHHQDIKGILLRHPKEQAAALYQQVLDGGFDAVNSRGYWRADAYSRKRLETIKRFILRTVCKRFTVSKCEQRTVNKYLYVGADEWATVYPTLIPQWDRTARSGKQARIWVNSTPELFKEQMEKALSLLEGRDEQHRILFLQSWNEWAEGNYVEPDMRYGHQYLNVLKEELL